MLSGQGGGPDRKTTIRTITLTHGPTFLSFEPALCLLRVKNALLSPGDSPKLESSSRTTLGFLDVSGNLTCFLTLPWGVRAPGRLEYGGGGTVSSGPVDPGSPGGVPASPHGLCASCTVVWVPRRVLSTLVAVGWARYRTGASCNGTRHVTCTLSLLQSFLR